MEIRKKMSAVLIIFSIVPQNCRRNWVSPLLNGSRSSMVALQIFIVILELVYLRMTMY